MESAFLSRSNAFNNNSIFSTLLDTCNVSSHQLPLDWQSLDLRQLSEKFHFNHYYFQAANLCFGLGFLATDSLLGQLYLRLTLIAGSGLLIAWALLVKCFLDVVLWNVLFVALNCLFAIAVLIRRRPISFPAEFEEVYQKLFRPLKVSRNQFRAIVNSVYVVRDAKPQEIIAIERVNKINTLTLVTRGKFSVSQNGRVLHLIGPHEFLDSAEWFNNVTNDFFQVSIVSRADSKLIVWHRDKLKLRIMNDEFLRNIFDHIIARDVVHKLIQVSESMSTNFDDKEFLGPAETETETETLDTLAVTNKQNNAININLLLNRQSKDEHVPLLRCPIVNNSNN